jgi:DNA-binding IclR family transcriptional regulator
VLKAFNVLRSFTSPDESLTSSELSRRAQLPEASGYRLVQTLEGIGALVRDSRGKYRLGMLLLSLSQEIASGDLWREVSHNVLARLAKEWRASAHVGVLENGMATYVATAGCSPMNIRVGMQLEAYCTALGKTLLAALSRDDLRAFLAEGELVALTNRTITEPVTFNAALQQIREQGYAFDDREMLDSLRCVAAPIRNPARQVVAAVSISSGEGEITAERRAAMRAAVISAAQEIGSKLYPWKTDAQVPVAGAKMQELASQAASFSCSRLGH